MTNKKIIVIGCPGSGKSHFSRKLAALTGLPLYHLDMIYWNENKTTVPKELFRARLAEIVQGGEWIIDGNYGSTMEARMDACDTVFFLDYPTELCLAGVEERMGKPRADMPWIETEWDEEFHEHIKNFSEKNRPKILALLERHAEKEIHVFKERAEAEAFLQNFRKEK